jgi:UDP-N-acetylglucosamine 4-epimerase
MSLMLVPRTWMAHYKGLLASFGSNLLEVLLKLNQKFIGLDNFLTGHRNNLEEVESLVPSESVEEFVFTEGDIRTSKHAEGLRWR